MEASENEVRVAMAALVKMIHLMGAELLVGRYREDIDVFEQAVRGKLFAHVDGVSAEETAAGVALAHALLDPALKHLRAQALQMRAVEEGRATEAAARRLN